ncbi:uncharacterized protein LOC143026673 [Oratosquilla oratoria]|uniref:uncharacterized protein LOC143026673 n=1 Tax=Oratosquilla oratoria TaxID=337810 RepID=UPI003F7588BB
MFLTPATPQVSRGNSGTSAAVKVVVRVRPLHPEEVASGFKNILTVNKLAKQVIVEDDKAFKFDAVYDVDTKQTDLYEGSIAPLIAKVKNGLNATVIAYGQTGSGKTYTMGTNPHAYKTSKESEGIVQRSLESLLQYEDKNAEKSLQVFMSFIEVYNESVYDLLTPFKNKLALKISANGGVTPVNVVEEQVHSIGEGSSILEKGSKHRAVSATALNQHSSRSHAIISLTIKDGEKCRSLRLVDLAGAEGVGKAKMEGQQFSEGVSINKSLLGLGKVLAALGNPVSAFIPYRDSMLTKILADSLGGNSHTCMVTCIHATKANLYETINTLRFAEQARNVRTRPFISSTTKHSGIKRRCEDVSSTPGAWKKRQLEKPVSHNSTISTPGRKAPDKIRNRTNSSFMTPTIRTSVLNSTALEDIQDDGAPVELIRKKPLRPSPSFPKGPLVFSDTSSPKSSLNLNISPLVEKVSSCLEEKMMKTLNKIEDNISEKIVSKLLGSKRTLKKKRSRISKHTSCSSPKSSVESPISLDSASPIIATPEQDFNQTFIGALFGKVDLKSVLQNLVQETMQSTQKGFRNQGCLDDYGKGSRKFISFGKENQELDLGSSIKPLSGRKGLKDSSNLFNSICHGQGNMMHETEKFQKMEDALSEIPFTSTAVCDVRAVRRSSRVSMRRSLHHILLKENLTPVKPVDKTWDDGGHPDVSNINETVVHRESRSVLTPTINLEPAFCAEAMGPLSNVTVLEKKEMPKCMEEDAELGPAVHLPEGNMMKSYLGSHQYMETTQDTSLLQIDKQLFQGVKPRAARRSSRHCAQKATALNAEILKNESPLRKRRSSLNKSKMSKTLNHTVNIVSSKNQTLEGSRWELVISPRLQQNHRKTVLTVLNTGDLRKLQQLPTVGPKSAMVIHNYRSMCGPFEKLEDLDKVPGLVKNFCSRFLRANLLSQIELI